jgi:hypothetical protein
LGYNLNLAGAKFAEDARQQARSCKLYRKRLLTPQIRQNRRPRRVTAILKKYGTLFINPIGYLLYPGIFDVSC